MAQYRACERCGRAIDDSIKHRGAWNTAGSVGGSLGGSYAGSAVLGSAFGFAGSIAGAVGGAIAGSKAGAEASHASCNAIDKAQSGKLCEACIEAQKTKAANYQNWGGGRLGGDGNSSAASASSPSAAESTMGTRFSGAASKAGENISRGASVAGEHISGAASWVRQSVTGKKEAASGNTGAGGTGAFVPFGGSGQTLGSAPARPVVRPQLGGGYRAAQAPSAPPPPTGQTQMEQDEAMARRLQEEFLMMDSQGQ